MPSTRTSLHIGINDYPLAVGTLRYCAADAAKLRKVLDGHRDGFAATQSILLVDDRAQQTGNLYPPTRANIIRHVLQVCEQATAEDTVLIQFSGHGALGRDGRLYLLPLDVFSG